MYHRPAAPPGSAPAKRDGGWAKLLTGYPLPASAEINLLGGVAGGEAARLLSTKPGHYLERQEVRRTWETGLKISHRPHSSASEMERHQIPVGCPLPRGEGGSRARRALPQLQLRSGLAAHPGPP